MSEDNTSEKTYSSFNELFEDAVQWGVVEQIKNRTVHLNRRSWLKDSFDEWLKNKKSWNGEDLDYYKSLLTKENFIQFQKFERQSSQQCIDVESPINADLRLSIMSHNKNLQNAWNEYQSTRDINTLIMAVRRSGFEELQQWYNTFSFIEKNYEKQILRTKDLPSFLEKKYQCQYWIKICREHLTEFVQVFGLNEIIGTAWVSNLLIFDNERLIHINQDYQNTLRKRINESIKIIEAIIETAEANFENKNAGKSHKSFSEISEKSTTKSNSYNSLDRLFFNDEARDVAYNFLIENDYVNNNFKFISKQSNILVIWYKTISSKKYNLTKKIEQKELLKLLKSKFKNFTIDRTAFSKKQKDRFDCESSLSQYLDTNLYRLITR